MYEKSWLNFITPDSCLQVPGSYVDYETQLFGLRKCVVFCSNCDQLLFTQILVTQRYDKTLTVNVVLLTNQQLKLIVLYIVLVRSGEEGVGRVLQLLCGFGSLRDQLCLVYEQQKYCYRQYVEIVHCQLNVGDSFRLCVSHNSASLRMRVATHRQSRRLLYVQLSFQFATVLRYVSSDCVAV